MAEAKQKVVVIAGPTGVGKTALSIALAKRLNGEIISGDSIQVYRGMDIGSAKITPEQMQGIPHHLIDELDYRQEYNVKLFQQRCRKAIDQIAKRGRLPIICGGTGLYIKAALYDYQFAEEPGDTEYERFLSSLSSDQLYGALQLVDPKACETIHPHNRRRVIRALLIAHNGEAKSAIVERQKHEMLYDGFLIGLTMPREQLYAQIDRRVDQMLEAGLLEEIRGLIRSDADWELRSFQGIGYKEWKPYFQGEASEEACREAVKKHSRQFAKRQYTWFKNQFSVHWFDVSEAAWKQRLMKQIMEWNT